MVDILDCQQLYWYCIETGDSHHWNDRPSYNQFLQIWYNQCQRSWHGELFSATIPILQKDMSGPTGGFLFPIGTNIACD